MCSKKPYLFISLKNRWIWSTSPLAQHWYYLWAWHRRLELGPAQQVLFSRCREKKNHCLQFEPTHTFFSYYIHLFFSSSFIYFFHLLLCRWFCHFDDDNYVNVPRLVDKLSQFDHRKDWYLGKPSLPEPLEILDRDNNHQQVRTLINTLCIYLFPKIILLLDTVFPRIVSSLE